MSFSAAINLFCHAQSFHFWKIPQHNKTVRHLDNTVKTSKALNSFIKMYSFKHNIVLNVGWDHVKLTRKEKRPPDWNRPWLTAVLFLLYRASIYRLSNCKDSEQSNFNSAETKGLNASQHEVSHKNIEKQLKLFPETMKTKPCCI